MLLEGRILGWKYFRRLESRRGRCEVRKSLYGNELSRVRGLRRRFELATALRFIHSKPLRNGSVFQFTASFDGRGTLFRDKPIDPSFGGTDTPNSFGNRLEAAWVQPLQRGRGADTVQAAERAAGKTLEASRFNFQQASADQALATARASTAAVAGARANESAAQEYVQQARSRLVAPYRRLQ